MLLKQEHNLDYYHTVLMSYTPVFQERFDHKTKIFTDIFRVTQFVIASAVNTN